MFTPVSSRSEKLSINKKINSGYCDPMAKRQKTSDESSHVSLLPFYKHYFSGLLGVKLTVLIFCPELIIEIPPGEYVITLMSPL